MKKNLPKWTVISKENIFLVAKNILNGIWTQEAIQNIQIQSWVLHKGFVFDIFLKQMRNFQKCSPKKSK